MSAAIVRGTIDYYMGELRDALSEELADDAITLEVVRKELFVSRWFGTVYDTLVKIDEERRNNE